MPLKVCKASFSCTVKVISVFGRDMRQVFSDWKKNVSHEIHCSECAFLSQTPTLTMGR